jgi:hypothetical protein
VNKLTKTVVPSKIFAILCLNVFIISMKKYFANLLTNPFDRCTCGILEPLTVDVRFDVTIYSYINVSLFKCNQTKYFFMEIINTFKQSIAKIFDGTKAIFTHTIYLQTQPFFFHFYIHLNNCKNFRRHNRLRQLQPLHWMYVISE